MPLSHVSKMYAIKQMKIAKLTADPVSGAATYAASILVPGAKRLAVTGTVATKYLRGDNTLLDSEATLENLNVAFDFAKMNLDVLSTMMGSTVTDAGVTPNQVATLRLLGGSAAPSQFQYFKIEATAVDTDLLNGDCHIVLWKCKLSDVPSQGFMEEDYQLFAATCSVAPRAADGFWMDTLYNESAVAIA